MKPIVVAYLADAKFGGWVSFTRNLVCALRSVGVTPIMRTVGESTAAMPKDFGFGLRYRRMRLRELVEEGWPTIIAAADKHHMEDARFLLDAGAKLVVHDPAEKHLRHVPHDSCIVIRRSMSRRMPKAIFIPHPYLPVFADAGSHPHARSAVICHARIDYDKHTDLLLAANDLGAGISIIGNANRGYCYRSLQSRWPEFCRATIAQIARRPRKAEWGAVACRGAVAAIDMSVIVGDGGGTQYTFLEAWDGGAPLIVHRKWLAGFCEDEMREGENCLAAETPEEVCAAIALVKSDRLLAESLARKGRDGLQAHSPERVAASYMSALGVIGD